MKVELCDKCARPLWEGQCCYCRGYKDGYLKAIKETDIEVLTNHQHIWTLERNKNVCIRCGVFKSLLKDK